MGRGSQLKKLELYTYLRNKLKSSNISIERQSSEVNPKFKYTSQAPTDFSPNFIETALFDASA